MPEPSDQMPLLPGLVKPLNAVWPAPLSTTPRKLLKVTPGGIPGACEPVRATRVSVPGPCDQMPRSLLSPTPAPVSVASIAV